MSGEPRGSGMSYGLAAAACFAVAAILIAQERLVVLLFEFERWHAIPALAASLTLIFGLHGLSRTGVPARELLVQTLLISVLFTGIFSLFDAKLFPNAVYIIGWLIGASLIATGVLAFLPVAIASSLTRRPKG